MARDSEHGVEIGNPAEVRAAKYPPDCYDARGLLIPEAAKAYDARRIPADPEWWRIAEECAEPQPLASRAARIREYGERQHAAGVLAERRRCLAITKSQRCAPDSPLHRGEDNTARLIAERIEAGE